MIPRIQFIILFLCVVIAAPLLAQTEKKQSFSFSYCPVTINSVTKDKSPYMHDDNNTKGVEYEALLGDYGYKAVGYDNFNYGALELAYKRILSRHFQFNLGLGCELSGKHWDVYDRPDGPLKKRIMDYRINLLPGIDFFILDHKYTKLWYSVQAGGLWIHRSMKYFEGSERDKLRPAWQLWLVFDQKISDTYSFNVGFGCGTLGIFKMGVSYHF